MKFDRVCNRLEFRFLTVAYQNTHAYSVPVISTNSSSVIHGASWIVLRDISQKELKEAKRDADIEYLAMMCDVEL